MVEEQAAAASPETRPGGALARLVGVFYAPARTFEEIGRRPTWLLPLLLWIACSVAVWVVMTPRVDWEQTMRDRIESSGQNVSQERMERILEGQQKFTWIYYVIAGGFPVILALCLSALFWLAFKAFGWELSFRQSLGVTNHAFLPAVLGSVLLLPLLFRQEKVDLARVDEILRSNPSFLVDRKESPAVHSLLSSLDLFALWVLALLVVGYAAAAKISPGRSAAVIVTLWALYVLGKSGFAALTAS
jgi:hypothetical protein